MHLYIIYIRAIILQLAVLQNHLYTLTRLAIHPVCVPSFKSCPLEIYRRTGFQRQWLERNVLHRLGHYSSSLPPTLHFFEPILCFLLFEILFDRHVCTVHIYTNLYLHGSKIPSLVAMSKTASRLSKVSYVSYTYPYLCIQSSQLHSCKYI